jgi:hypothetical protein
MTKDKISQTLAIREELAALREEIAVLQQELVETHALAAEALRLAQEADALSAPVPRKLLARKRPAKSPPRPTRSKKA